jgi:hypothetical protein
MQGLDASKYSGSIDCAKQIVAKEGLKGLYKGTVNLILQINNKIYIK